VPIGTRPNRTYEYVLVNDRENDNPPVFICKHWTVEESRAASILCDKLSQQDNFNSISETAIELIVCGLVGWNNMVVDGNDILFPDEKAQLKNTLSQLLSVDEASELSQIIGEQGFTAKDKKKSESPLLSDTEQSAKTAKDEASAKKSPAKT